MSGGLRSRFDPQSVNQLFARQVPCYYEGASYLAGCSLQPTLFQEKNRRKKDRQRGLQVDLATDGLHLDDNEDRIIAQAPNSGGRFNMPDLVRGRVQG